MPARTVIAAAFLIGAAAAALAQTNAPTLNAAPTETQTPSGRQTQTISPSGPATQDTRVNPSAAGTQMGWQGYAATSGVKANRERSGSTEAAIPNMRPLTAQSARDRLAELGYRRISGLRQLGDGGWQATARKGNREGIVRLDKSGEVVAGP